LQEKRIDLLKITIDLLGVIILCYVAKYLCLLIDWIIGQMEVTQ